MPSSRQNLRKFRPAIDGISLEDRVVLNGGAGSLPRAIAAAAMPAAGGQQNAAASALSRRQLLQSYRTQLQAASNDLRQYARDQIRQLYANGTPTQAQISDLRDQLAGAVNATAFRVSGQLALLPNATERLVAGVQNNLLANNGTSLLSRFNRLLDNQALTQSPARLATLLNRSVSANNFGNLGQLNSYLTTTPINRLSVDATTGQAIPIQQYMAQQALFQFGNSLGSLANSFPNVANTAIFQNGALNSDAAIQSAFAGQLTNAVGLTANQLANNLAVFSNNSSLFPGGSTNVLSPISQSLFGGGTTGGVTNNLFAALGQIPTTGTTDQFFQGVNTAFTTTFNDVNNVLNPYFGTTSTGGVQTLPPSPYWNIYQTFGNTQLDNFNNGFGSGFVGFGQPSTGIGTGTIGNAFGTGFNSLTGTQNTNFGFTNPSFLGFGMTNTGTGGIGTGTGGIGTGTGTGGIGTGTGTGGIGTGTGGIGTGTGGIGTGTGGIGTGTGGIGTGTGGIGTGTII